MNMKQWALGCLVALTAVGVEANMTAKPVRVVLVGASIGQDWNLAGLPGRAKLSGYEFEAVQAWQYDKSEALEETLMRPKRKFRLTPSYVKGFFKASPQPADVIILKECSAYFPGDQQPQRKQELMETWVRSVQEKNIKVMLATVVPVTKQRAAADPGKLEAVLAYNDWVRAYAKKNNIPLLDLEAALRADGRERYLRDDLTSGDGSHLNRKAYDVLDGVMAQAVCKLQANGACTAKQASAR